MVKDGEPDPIEEGEKESIDEAYGFPAYLRRRKRQESLRWKVSLVFIILLISFLLLPVYYSNASDNPIPWCFGSIFLIILTFLALHSLEANPDPNNILYSDLFQGSPKTSFSQPIPITQEVWHQRIVSWEMIAITWVTGSLLILILLIEPGDAFCSFLFLPPIMLVIYYCLFYWRLDIRCTTSNLILRYNWSIQTTIQLSSIISIRSVVIDPLREFMGWGKLHATDGSVGYISSGRVGVRIHLRNGQRFVVTVRDPQSLVNFITWWKWDEKRRETTIEGLLDEEVNE